MPGVCVQDKGRCHQGAHQGGQGRGRGAEVPITAPVGFQQHLLKMYKYRFKDYNPDQ